MKVLIVRTDINESDTSRSMSGTDAALTMELYSKYVVNVSDWDDNACRLRICANNYYDKFTFIDEKKQYIGSFRTMDDLIASQGFLGNVITLTHEQWLDKQCPQWKTNKHYQSW